MREIPAVCRGAGPDSGGVPYTGSTSGKPADVGDDPSSTRDEVLHLPPGRMPKEKSIRFKQNVLLLEVTDWTVLCVIVHACRVPMTAELSLYKTIQQGNHRVSRHRNLQCLTA